MSQQGSGVGRVVRAGFWTYGLSLVNNVFGFGYWLVISSLAGSEVLGLTSATIGLSALVIGIIALGVPAGVQRFLGREWGRGDLESFRTYFWSTLFHLAASYLVAGTLLLALGVAGVGFLNFGPEMLKMASVLVLLGFAVGLNSFLVSILRTDVLFVAGLIGNVLKFAVGVGLVYAGFGWVGAVLGYACVNLSNVAVGMYYALKTIGFHAKLSYTHVAEVIRAGLAVWLPDIVVMLGQWRGVLTVFGLAGAVSTGHYYIALTLSGAVLMVGSSMVSLLLPYLSGLADGRKRAASRVFGMAEILVVPLSFALMVYPWVPLRLLGSEYVDAAPVLSVLLLSAVPLLLTGTVNSLVYSYGFYRDVLFVGLAQNVPRLVLYLLLVPLYGGLGAAVAFTVGAYAALPVVVRVARGVGYRIGARRLLGVAALPGVLAAFCFLAGVPWFLGVPVILSSYLLYARLGLVTRRDLRMVGEAFMSVEELEKLYERFRPLVDALFPY